MIIAEIATPAAAQFRHPLEAPELTLQGMFYPLGFPTELRTNSDEILSQAAQLWSIYEKRFNTAPIRVDVHVVEGDNDAECPPNPEFRMMQPMLLNMANADNFSLANLERGSTQIVISRATEKHRNYLAYFFLGGAPLPHICTRFVTPVHAACVALKGRGVLLCGDSGAGKSSLAFACAQAGWTYVTDDASLLLHISVSPGSVRQVLGNCHQVRFRPTAAELFPELQGLEITPRAAGKPSIELPTAPMNLICAETAKVDFLVFLNRRTAPLDGPPSLRPYSKDVARQAFRQVLFGSQESIAVQHAEIERLLTAEVLKLEYTSLNQAIDQLETLVRSGS